MVMLNIYSIFDEKAEVFNAPFFMPRDGMALRAFADLVNDKNTTPGQHPDDFKLVFLGTFDEAKGVLAAGEMRTLGFGGDYLERDKVLARVGGA